MKKLVLFSFFITGYLIGNTQVLWSSEVDVASGLDNKRPRIVLSNGNPIVLWGDESGSSGVVYSARWNGSSFDAPIQINPSGVDAFVSWWGGPEIAAKDSNIYIVFDAQPEEFMSVYVVKSTDGGITYSDTIAVDNPSDLTRFSSLAIDDSNNPIIMYMTHSGNWTQPEYSINKSNDGGQTWNGNTIISNQTGSEVCDCCPPSLHAGNGMITALFRNNDNNLRDFWVSHSTDNGLTFPTQMDIDNSDWMIGGCPSSGADMYYYGDTVVSVWMTGSTGSNRIKYGGFESNSSFVIDAKELSPSGLSTVIQNFPRIAGANEKFGIAFQETKTGNHDIMFTYSDNGLNGLVDSVFQVNSDATGAQRNVDIAFDGVDTYHFVWQDDPSVNVKYRTATITGPWSVQENIQNEIKLYPNPSNGIVNVSCGSIKNGELQIQSLDGKLIQSSNFNQALKLDASGLPSGTYICTLRSLDGREVMHKKFTLR